MHETRYEREHDTLVVGAWEALGSRLRLNDDVVVNGETRSRKSYPQLRGLARARTLVNATVSSLSLRTGVCSLCGAKFASRPQLIEEPGDDLPAYRAATSLEHCTYCRHWEFLELRTETVDARADLVDRHTITLVNSKTRSFDSEAPEGTLSEVAQFFRRNPRLYNSVAPRYLEQLVARIFRDSGNYAEVTHVGRPDDGGVDVVLVESDEASWLVQVKRRESPAAVESVSTVRNLLGTLILENSDRGVVVSTADHFSLRARQAVDRSAGSGFLVRLLDRSALDALLGRALPEAPWEEVLGQLTAERWRWFGWSPATVDVGDVRGDYDPLQFRLFD